MKHHVLAIVLGMLALAVTLPAAPAYALTPGLGTMQACIRISPLQRTGGRCTFQRDCPSGTVCHETRCVRHVEARDEPWREIRSEYDQQPSSSAQLLDDGGADAVCGADRRCRIERIKNRNQHRRHVAIAEQERLAYQEVERILARRKEDVPRLDRPWFVALQYHPTGWGLRGGHTFFGHLRAEATVVYQDRWLYHVPDDPQLPAADGYHQAWFFATHATYVPSQAWFSPMLSLGFTQGFGNLNYYSSGMSPGLRYHAITGAVGVEAQFEVGLFVSMALRHGYLLYNQARYSAGSYDPGLRGTLKDYMNSRGLFGFDFSIGWAF